MANVHGFNDIPQNNNNNNNNRNRNNPLRNPMLQGYSQQQSQNAINQQIRQNKVPFLNSMVSDKNPLQQTIPYTLKLVWCPTLKLLSVTTFYLISIWVVYIICLAKGIDTSKGMVLAPKISTLLQFGAISYYPIHNGQVWRLLTAAFLHADLLHIVMNSISILFFMSRVQKCYNFKIMLLLCLASAISGSLASVMFLPRDNTVSVGASTVIFGVMGGLLSYMTINWTVLGRVRSQLCCIVGLITFLAVLTSLNGEVDLAGHLGGMFGGYMCGIAIFPAIKQKDKRFTIVGTSCLAIYLLVMLLVFYL